MRGRPAKKTEELKKQGTFRDDRHKGRLQDELPAATEIPPAPSGMSKRQKELWKEATENMLSLGILNTVDTVFLTRYCELSEQYEKAWADVENRGISIMNGKIERANPNFTAAKDMLAVLFRMYDKMGFHPQSRQSIKIQTKPKTKRDPIKEALNFKGGSA